MLDNRTAVLVLASQATTTRRYEAYCNVLLALYSYLELTLAFLTGRLLSQPTSKDHTPLLAVEISQSYKLSYLRSFKTRQNQALLDQLNCIFPLHVCKIHPKKAVVEGLSSHPVPGSFSERVLLTGTDTQGKCLSNQEY